jgi:hypothetical protein
MGGGGTSRRVTSAKGDIGTSRDQRWRDGGGRPWERLGCVDAMRGRKQGKGSCDGEEGRSEGSGVGPLPLPASPSGESDAKETRRVGELLTKPDSYIGLNCYDSISNKKVFNLSRVLQIP